MPDGNEITVTTPPAPAKGKRLFYQLFLWGALVLVLLWAAPNYMKARVTPCKNACINNLRQIDGAKEQYALENQLKAGSAVTPEQIGEYIKGGVVPKCPGGGKYTIGPVGEEPVCSFGEGTHRLTLARK